VRDAIQGAEPTTHGQERTAPNVEGGDETLALLGDIRDSLRRLEERLGGAGRDA